MAVCQAIACHEDPMDPSPLPIPRPLPPRRCRWRSQPGSRLWRFIATLALAFYACALPSSLVAASCATAIDSVAMVASTTSVRHVVSQSQAAWTEGEALNRSGDGRCVDAYYRAALLAAQVLEVEASACGLEGAPAWQIHHSALACLIEAGQYYGRLDPRGHLLVMDGCQRIVPIRYCGFAWRPSDFSRLVAAGQFHTPDIAHNFATPGLGHSLVAVRIASCPDEIFFPPRLPFAVTAILRPTNLQGEQASPGSVGGCDSSAVLELYNPHVFDQVSWGNGAMRISRDLTAPLAAIVEDSPRQYLRGFTAPTDASVQPKLTMLEPYQRGKIPVVFIHGLYSDPITWADMVNDLRAMPDLYQQYQFWTFRYPTGGDALDSTTALRQNLNLARKQFDALHEDVALDEMVLVGHSLGGLVSKMQIATSYDILWQHVALQPFDALRAPPPLAARLADNFFFEPVPSVSRVVFIGTPHRGSTLSRRLAGRIGSSLVRYGPAADAQYQQLMEANADVFRPELQQKRPTSVDLLEPTSPFLAALAEMPVNPCVRIHSIIGTGGCSVLSEPGDGVVTVTSARYPGVESELFVPAKHEMLHRHPDAIAELARILREHLARVPGDVNGSCIDALALPSR